MTDLSVVESHLEYLHEWVEETDVIIHFKSQPIAVLQSYDRYQTLKADILRNSLRVGAAQAKRGEYEEFDFDKLMDDDRFNAWQLKQEQRDPPSYPKPEFDYQLLLDAVDKHDPRYWFREIIASTSDRPVRAAYLQADDRDFVVMSAYEYVMLEQENLHVKLQIVVAELLFGESLSFNIDELMAEAGDDYPRNLSISELEQLRELLTEYNIRCSGSGTYTGYTVNQILEKIKQKRT